MNPDFPKSLERYQKVLKALGCERAEQTTRLPIVIYSGVKDLWVPSLLVSDEMSRDRTVRTVYMSPIPTRYGPARAKGLKGVYTVFPNIHVSTESVGNVRTVDREAVPDLWSTLRALDAFFFEASHDPEPLVAALWRMNFPERPAGEERKRGAERTDPPVGSLPLDLPVMSRWQQLAAALSISR